MAPALLDTNILLRHLSQDHAEQSPRATAYLHRIEQGELKVPTSDIVHFETAYTLQRFCRHPKLAIRDAALPILELLGMLLPGKRRFRKVFDLSVDLNISFADAYHAVLMGQWNIARSLATTLTLTGWRGSRG